MESVSGDIELDGVSGELDISLVSGDVDLRAGFSVFGPLSAFVGYRDNAIEVDYVDGTDAGRIDLSIGGPYLGVRASF